MGRIRIQYGIFSRIGPGPFAILWPFLLVEYPVISRSGSGFSSGSGLFEGSTRIFFQKLDPDPRHSTRIRDPSMISFQGHSVQCITLWALKSFFCLNAFLQKGNGWASTIMVLILDGTSIIGALVRSNLCYLVCLRHSIRSRAVKNRFFFVSEIISFP